MNEIETFAFCPDHYEPFSSAIPNGNGAPGDRCPFCQKPMLACDPAEAFAFRMNYKARRGEALGMGRVNEETEILRLVNAALHASQPNA